MLDGSRLSLERLSMIGEIVVVVAEFAICWLACALSFALGWALRSGIDGGDER